jgi:hypothetical protein
MVCAVVSSVTVAKPVPGDILGGASFGPDRAATYVNVAAGACIASATTNPPASQNFFIDTLHLKLVAHDGS